MPRDDGGKLARNGVVVKGMEELRRDLRELEKEDAEHNTYLWSQRYVFFGCKQGFVLFDRFTVHSRVQSFSSHMIGPGGCYR